MKKSDKWTLKKLIKKADDVDLNTAIALSKSLSDEEKAKKKRSKREKYIPLNLMKEAKQVKEVLNARFSDYILQYSVLREYECTQPSIIWDKSSLISEISPGDLSYNDINETERSVFYVGELSGKISPAKYRMGDKIISMSEIPGRECSQILLNTSHLSHSETPLSNSRKPVEFDEINDMSVVCNDNFTSQSQEICDKTDSADGLSLNNESLTSSNRIMNMFNNPKFSDMFILLKSGAILRLHKFIFAAWNCDDTLLQENQWFISDIDDYIPIKIFKYLYSNGTESIDDIIETEECEKICRIFGIRHSSLIRKLPQTSDSININHLHSSTYGHTSPTLCSPVYDKKMEDSSVYHSTDFDTPTSQIIKLPVNDNNISLSPSTDDVDNNIDFQKISRDSKSSNKTLNYSQASVDLFESTFDEHSIEMKLSNSNISKEFSSDACSNGILESTKSLEILNSVCEQEILSNICSNVISDLTKNSEISGDIQTFNENIYEENEISDSNKTPFTSPKNKIYESTQNKLHETPLPFFQRMGFKNNPQFEDGKLAIVDLCSDERDENNEEKISLNTGCTNSGSDTDKMEVGIEQNSQNKTVKRKSKIEKDCTQAKLPKTNLKVNTDDSVNKPSKSTRVRKKKSSESVKQPVIKKIGDTMVDTPEINKRAADICLKKSLSKKHKLLILQKVHDHQNKQNDRNETDSSSSTMSEDDADGGLIGEFVMTQRTQTTQLDKPRDWSPELFQFLKLNYYRDILTYKPLTVDTLHKELSMNNIKIDMKSLKNYLDAKCIAYQASATTNKLSHPKVARKMVL